MSSWTQSHLVNEPLDSVLVNFTSIRKNSTRVLCGVIIVNYSWDQLGDTTGGKGRAANSLALSSPGLTSSRITIPPG